MAYPARTIADWFLARAAQDRQPLTQMKLQKLVYIAHGWHLALYDERLILEPIEAWRWGPVIKSLYAQFARFGSETIDPPSFRPHVDQRTEDLLERVWLVYRPYSATQLSAMTHGDNTPWSNAYSPETNAEITEQSIREHYLELAKSGK